MIYMMISLNKMARGINDGYRICAAPRTVGTSVEETPHTPSQVKMGSETRLKLKLDKCLFSDDSIMTLRGKCIDLKKFEIGVRKSQDD